MAATRRCFMSTRRRSAELIEESADLHHEARLALRVEALAQRDHAVESDGFQLMAPERLADQPLHAIAIGRRRHEAPRERNAEARSTAPSRRDMQHRVMA